MTTAQHPRQQSGMRLPVRVFLVMAALLGVTVVTISATMLYRNAHALQEEAQSAAIQTVELLSTQFAEIGEISLANVARTLDSALNDQMVAQARIAAHLVAAAEQTGYQPSEILVILDEIVAGTALEEIWITDETGFTYLTTLRDQEGRRFRFTFDPDPMVQPQASKFYGLLDAAGNDYITQPAQVREIDKKVFKYVGVQGIDKPRIVEVGNEIVLGEQEILIEAYTSTRADVSAVIEGILVQEMETQALMLGSLVAVMEDGGHPAASINATLEQITASSVIGAIAVTDGEGRGIYRSGNAATDGYPAPDDLATASERPAMNARTVPWPGGAQAKQVSWTRPDSAYLVHVDIPIEGASGNLLYFVYQSQADLLAQSGNLVSLWVANRENELVAAAPRAGMLTAEGSVSAFSTFGEQAQGLVAQALDTGSVASIARLGLLNPAQRGLWVAAPVVNAGGILIGGIALEISLDSIARTLQMEFVRTFLITLALLALTAVTAFAGARWLTHPIEIIADVAREVESGIQPEQDSMRQAMSRRDEIGALARVFSDMTVQVFNREEKLEILVAERTHELQASNRQLIRAKESMDQDLEMAKVVQTALVQGGRVQSGSIQGYTRMTPAKQVGGDFVMLQELTGGRLFFVVGDVSGKGVSASLFMVAVQAAISNAAESCSGISEIAGQANRDICRMNPMSLFVTCAMGLVNTRTGVIDYIHAGHDPGLYFEASGDPGELPLTDGLAMGVEKGFDYAPRQWKLSPGDTMFLYTDGLTDAVDRNGRMFGEQKLFDALAAVKDLPLRQIVDRLWQAIADFSAGAPAADDMTCLILRRDA